MKLTDPIEEKFPMLRWGLPALLMGFGVVTMHRNYDQGNIIGVLMGLAVTVMGGGWLAPFITEKVAHRAGRLFHNGEYLDKPPPRYSEVTSRRAFGDYGGAVAALWEIIGLHPTEKRAWHELMEIQLLHLHDAAAARHVFLQARNAMPAPEDRIQLEQVWGEIQARAERQARCATEPGTPLFDLPPAEGLDARSVHQDLPAPLHAQTFEPSFELPPLAALEDFSFRPVSPAAPEPSSESQSESQSQSESESEPQSRSASGPLSEIGPETLTGTPSDTSEPAASPDTSESTAGPDVTPSSDADGSSGGSDG